MKSLRTLALLGAIAGVFVISTSVRAQSLISGDIAGVVTDATSAVISGADVNLTNTDTGAIQNACHRIAASEKEAVLS